MKPVKNITSTTRYKGMYSGRIYTLLHYVPCYDTVRDTTCRHKPCYFSCIAVCEHSHDNRMTVVTSFNAQGIDGWRIEA